MKKQKITKKQFVDAKQINFRALSLLSRSLTHRTNCIHSHTSYMLLCFSLSRSRVCDHFSHSQSLSSLYQYHHMSGDHNICLPFFFFFRFLCLCLPQHCDLFQFQVSGNYSCIEYICRMPCVD